MHLVVNGERRSFDLASSTVESLLAALGMPVERVAVEVNGSIVPKRERADRNLVDGDVLEIVTLVGGG
jgi:thiamine biosynthesis protein ThiS